MTPASGSSRLPGHGALLVSIAVACLLLGSTGGALAGSLITGKDIKNSSLTGKDIKDKSLTDKELSAAALAALTGPTGAKGAPGQNAYQIVDGPQTSVSGGQTTSIHLDCPAGTAVLGASFRQVSGESGTQSGAPAGSHGWDMVLFNPTVSDASVVPFAVCTRA